MAKKKRVASMKFVETLRRLERERLEHLDKRKNRKRLRQETETAQPTEEMHEARIEADAGAKKKRRIEGDAPAVDTTQRAPLVSDVVVAAAPAGTHGASGFGKKKLKAKRY